jgi:hypothetical protein
MPSHDIEVGRTQRGRVLAQRLRGLAIALHHHHARRTPRQRLETESAAAGEEVEAGEPVQALAEPVEERFAHTVRRGTQRRIGRELHDAAAPLARDDPYAIRGTSQRGHRRSIIP